MAVCFLNYHCLPSHAVFAATGGTLMGFLLCSAVMETQKRWDKKIEEGIALGYLWKVQYVCFCEPFTVL